MTVDSNVLNNPAARDKGTERELQVLRDRASAHCALVVSLSLVFILIIQLNRT